ncbi:MAG: hypothetical protein KDC43_27510 [Saprospiraceae bacterium]|nr:hypothetical protein [Saprospiraceae bacterium]
MGQKISVDLDDDDVAAAENPETEKVRALASGRPSVHKAKIQGYRDADRVQFAFSNMPKPIKEMFDAEAYRRGMSKKEFLFHCLRAGGLDIPPFSEIDARYR